MTKEEQFWEWFKLNEAKYYFLNQIDNDEEKELLLDNLLTKLHGYCERLFFEVGGHPNEMQELIITAGGNVDFFDQVDSLVSSAPELKLWNIIAFKQIQHGFTTRYNGIEMNPGLMYFEPLEKPGSDDIGLRIYIDNYLPSNNEEFVYTAYLVLDNLLGEKSVALDIGYVEVGNLSSIAEKEDLIELTKLPRYIKWKKSNPNT